MVDKLTNFISFFRPDYVMWNNLVLRSVYSKIMHIERINIIEKVYVNKFQLESLKNDLWQERCKKPLTNLSTEEIWDYMNSKNQV